MLINYLKEFAVLAQTCNYQEAAFNLFISQGTLSKHIINIETELGVSLFDRTTRKVKLSEYGELFLPYAIKITQTQIEYSTAIKEAIDKNEDSIVVGAIPALAEYNITEALIKFKKCGTKCQLSVVQDGSTGLIEMLRSNKCDLAFIREESNLGNEFVTIPYFTDNLVAVFPTNHKLSKNKKISLLELKNEDFLLLEESSMLYKMVIEESRKYGFEPSISFTDHKIENLLDLSAKGMGIALIMKQHALYHAAKNVIIVDVEPIITSRISLCYKKSSKLSDSVKLFINCAKLLNKKEGIL